MSNPNGPHPAQIVKHIGTGLAILGVLLFLSTFISAALNFGNFDNFDERGRSMALRAVFGFIFMIAGGAVHGVASSQERSKGDNFNDGNWSPGSDSELAGPINIRGPSCRALNDEAAKYCDQGGKNL